MHTSVAGESVWKPPRLTSSVSGSDVLTRITVECSGSPKEEGFWTIGNPSKLLDDSGASFRTNPFVVTSLGDVDRLGGPRCARRLRGFPWHLLSPPGKKVADQPELGKGAD
jgi:hypothetical protein